MAKGKRRIEAEKEKRKRTAQELKDGGGKSKYQRKKLAERGFL